MVGAYGSIRRIVHILARETPVIEKSLCKAPRELTSIELDKSIELAEANGDLEALALYVPYRLERNGMVHNVILLLMARDLHFMYTHNLWMQYGYESFPEWVAAEFSSKPYGQGKKYGTVMALINVWQFYHVMEGWSLEQMSVPGKAKLERMLATAQSSTKMGTQPIDEDVVAVLMDEDAPHARVMDAYNERKAVKAAQKQGAEPLAVSPNRHVAYTADSTTGILHAWLPITERNGSEVGVELGKLDFRSERASPWLHLLLKRAKVKIR